MRNSTDRPFRTAHARQLAPLGSLAALIVCIAAVGGCDHSTAAGQDSPAAAEKPNILLIVWDTVRADRLGLYGHDRPTTPNVERWARQAHVFDNCASAASTTVPAHAAMFTGLYPSEHGANNESPLLAESFETLAERLARAGYRTYAFSENPFVCEETKLVQGFEVVEHPWSPQYQAQALRITQAKLLPHDRTSNLAANLRRARGDKDWFIKASGELAQKGLEDWLQQQDDRQPFFAFLNYMEAHRPLIPPVEYRRRVMTPEQVRASYTVDRSRMTVWTYVFGLHEYTPDEIELTRATYDAAVLELDDLFGRLLESLESKGLLRNTVVVLVGDHGEHLGDHHMLGHQFSVYEGLLRVPLAVHYPPRFPAGRDPRPVSNMDLFPTLLELAGVDPGSESAAVSLLRPLDRRQRMGELPEIRTEGHQLIRRRFPDFDPSPWMRTLRAFYDPPYKFIDASDGRHELYHLGEDPEESRNLVAERTVVAERLAADLREHLGRLRLISPAADAGPRRLSDELSRKLEALGYVGNSENDDEESEAGESSRAPETQPASKKP